MEHKKTSGWISLLQVVFFLAIIVAGIYTLIYDWPFPGVSRQELAEVCVAFVAGAIAFRAFAVYSNEQPVIAALPISTLHAQPQRHASDSQAYELKERDEWDVFISHASENRDGIARPLAEAFRAKGLRVWYDEFSLTVGDSLRKSIDHGLAHSRFGVVILSKHFFEKHWPEKELNALATREIGGKKVILPVWHEVEFEEVRQYSPTLADRLAVATKKGLASVVTELLKVVN